MPLRPDADLPAVPASSEERARPVPARSADTSSTATDLAAPPAGTDGGRAADGRSTGVPWRPAVGLVLACGLLGLAVPGLAALLGEDFREAVLVEVDIDPAASEPTWSDAPFEAARFFAERDTVTVVVPRDMTLAQFLALHHLETHTGVREAVREQLGLSEPSDLLREGDRVTLPLTLRRERP